MPNRSKGRGQMKSDSTIYTGPPGWGVGKRADNPLPLKVIVTETRKRPYSVCATKA